MSSLEPERPWQEWEQGDRLILASPVHFPALPGRPVGDVLVISQTCDVVQPSKPALLLAPVLACPGTRRLESSQGKSPLVLLPPGDEVAADQTGRDDLGGMDSCAAFLEYAASFLKVELVVKERIARGGTGAASQEARSFARRIGAVFARFPVPDPMVPALSRLVKKVRKEAPRSGSIAGTLSHVREIRVRARDGWHSQRGTRLELVFIVDAEYLVSRDIWESVDIDWSKVEGVNGRQLDQLELAQVCNLINSQSNDLVRGHLWERFADIMADFVETDEVVTECCVDAVSENDYKYADWRNSESLNLESLSDPL